MTPLIDVIFILVMFFLLSSTFGVWRPLEISLGGAARSAPETQQNQKPTVPPVLISVRANPGSGTVRLTVNGVDLDLGHLMDELDRLAGLGAKDAVLVPTKGTSFQQVVQILDAARSSRIRSVSLKLD